MPALVEPMLTEEQTKSVSLSACGMLYEKGLRGVPVPLEWGGEEA